MTDRIINGYMSNDGYYIVYINGKQIGFHRYIWEQHHGPITKGMEIHHINGDKLDNRIENLMLVDRNTHRKLHAGYQTIDGIVYKPCCKCGVIKPVTEYYSSDRKNGVKSTCKECKSEYNREYHQDNKEASIEYHKEYYKNHKEASKEYYIKNKDKINKQCREYYQRKKLEKQTNIIAGSS